MKIKKPIDDFMKWKLYDGLEILYPGNIIIFGSLDNFWKIYEFLFCYLILWKGEHDFLLPPERLFELIPQTEE